MFFNSNFKLMQIAQRSRKLDRKFIGLTQRQWCKLDALNCVPRSATKRPGDKLEFQTHQTYQIFVAAQLSNKYLFGFGK